MSYNGFGGNICNIIGSCSNSWFYYMRVAQPSLLVSTSYRLSAGLPVGSVSVLRDIEYRLCC